MAKGDTKPVGHQYALAMIEGGEPRVRELATTIGDQLSLNSFLSVATEEPLPAFLHSALCAMSLPLRCPKDDTKPIMRVDGRYALAINPKPILSIENGQPVMRSLGIPYGAYPRMVLIYLLSEAVRTNSRDVFLGNSFAAWMRRLGYEKLSYGIRGTGTQLKLQIEKLLACEWQIRWDDEPVEGEDAGYAFKEVKLANEHAGLRAKDGAFQREIRLSEAFYSHLREHAVPLNERALAEIKTKPTALDLYTYLAYRLPRIDSDRTQTITWRQLSKHVANECATMGKFRQQIRQTWQKTVSLVYPQADVDFDDEQVIKLRASAAPIERRLVGAHLGIVNNTRKRNKAALPFSAPSKEPEAKITFPASIRYTAEWESFRTTAHAKSGGADLDILVTEFRRWGRIQAGDRKPKTEWLRIFDRFCETYAERRRNEG
ncbi:replication protein RepA, partial [Sphingomonas oryzagri]